MENNHLRTTALAGLIALLAACNSIQRLYTVFPEARIKITAQPVADNIIRIYFDRVGYIYPADESGFLVTDNTLRDDDSRLPRYYHNESAVYQKICAYYHVPATPVDDHSKTYDNRLQTKLVESYTALINKAAVNKTLVFLIHGFNSPPLTKKDTGSYDEFRLTEQAITNTVKHKDYLFVEVYWDGLDDTNGAQNFLSVKLNDIKIWPHAQSSATYVGLELRRIFSGLNAKHIDVLTHSHGAGLITTALFNTFKFNKETGEDYSSTYQDKDSWLIGIQDEYEHAAYNTPTQDFTIGMLAPAIPGSSVFQDYHGRTVGGKLKTVTTDNYHFIIGFNQYDPITSKFHLFPTKIGSTSLGSIPAEVQRVHDLFPNDPGVIRSVDFSRYPNGDKQSEHAWLRYLYHTPQIDQFLSETIQ